MIPLLAAAATPIVKALMERGLTTLAGAVANKGKEFVEEKLGVKLEEDISPEQAVRYKELEIENEQDLRAWALENRRLDLEDKKLDNENTQGARTMNTSIQQSENATRLAKNAAYYLDFLVIGATLLLAYFVLFRAVPDINKELFYMAFGSLLTLCGTIINFHRGTSKSSQGKDATIAALTGASDDRRAQ